MMAYLYRGGDKPMSISRIIDVKKHLHLIANSVVYTPARARQLVAQYLESAGGCGCGPNGCGPSASAPLSPGMHAPLSPGLTNGFPSKTEMAGGEGLGVRGPTPLPRPTSFGEASIPGLAGVRGDHAVLDEFVIKALAEKLNGEEVFRITLTAFLDVHNFDTRRVMKCCLAHILPSGHVVPFCAYNTLYRDGHVALPALVDEARKSLALV
jgi:hypothetical protein